MQSETIFGTLPITVTENGVSLPYGQGSNHPIGLSFRDMMFNFWEVKSYKISIQALTIIDPFLTFLQGGGTVGGIIGALNGLSLVTQLLSQGDKYINGNTKIVDENLKPIENPSQVQGVCGFKHFLGAGDGSVTIDFSNLIIKNDLYYPKIIINIGPNSSLSSDVDTSIPYSPNFFLGDLVLFDGYGIEVYAYTAGTTILGSIKPDKYF